MVPEYKHTAYTDAMHHGPFLAGKQDAYELLSVQIQNKNTPPANRNTVAFHRSGLFQVRVYFPCYQILRRQTFRQFPG